MTMMKVKNDDDDEANAMVTITTAPETTMATAELATVNRIVDFDGKYQSFIVVDRATFHEDDEAILGRIKWDCNDKAPREAAGVAAAVASLGRSSLWGLPRTKSVPRWIPPHCCRSRRCRWRRRRRRRRRCGG